MEKLTKPPTYVGGVRLRADTWIMLRELMRHHGGRLWLEKAVETAHRKLKTGKAKNENDHRANGHDAGN